MLPLSSFSVSELLQFYVAILDELQRREIIRTANSPLGDYTEWLVAQRLGLKLSGNSTAGYDAIASDGTCYQIKPRRNTPTNSSRQLGAIRNLAAHQFDYLIALIFDSDFRVQQAVKIPHSVIADYATYRPHVNAHILRLQGAVLSDVRVEDITSLFTSEHSSLL